MSNENDDAPFVVFCIIILVFGSLVYCLPIPEPEQTTVIEDEQGVAVFIAIHPYFDHWTYYNGTVSIDVGGRIETGNCIDSWFLTSWVYERGTNYVVYINGTIVAEDWIGLVGDFGTWKGASWWGYVGSLVEVCHINLTLSVK